MLTPESFQSIHWQSPWRFVGIGEGGSYEQELLREVQPGHPLHGLQAIAVGVRVDQDDVLFLLLNAPKPLAVVHLKYTSGVGYDTDSPTKSPVTKFYNSLDNWLARGMAADHAEYLRGDVDDNNDE